MTRDRDELAAERGVHDVDEPGAAVGERHEDELVVGSAYDASPSAIAAAASTAERVPANLSGAMRTRTGPTLAVGRQGARNA